VTFKERLVVVRGAKWFSNLTTAIIIFYASVLGFKTIGEVENNYTTLLTILDYMVTVYFLVEILIKLYAEERTLDFFKSGWNVFDFIIVVITVVPMENTAIAPVARILRIFRVLRLLTSRPELKKIIDMLIKAIPSIVDIVILMFIVFYVYAIIGNFLFEDAASGLWSDFLISMLTLFRILTFEDWTDVMYEGMEIYPWSWIYFVSFVIIAAFVFFNLFVAVIIGEMEKINNKDMVDEMHEDHDKIDLILAELKAVRQELDEIKNTKQ